MPCRVKPRPAESNRWQLDASTETATEYYTALWNRIDDLLALVESFPGRLPDSCIVAPLGGTAGSGMMDAAGRR